MHKMKPEMLSGDTRTAVRRPDGGAIVALPFVPLRSWRYLGLFASLIGLITASQLHYEVSEPVFWPANGVLSLMLLLAGPRERWIVAGGAYIIHTILNLVVEKDGVVDALMISLSVVVEALVVAYATRRWCGSNPDFSRLATLFRFALLCSAPVVAVLDMGFGLLRRVFIVYPYWQEVSQWISVDFFGIIMVVPALHLILVPRHPGLFESDRTERTILFGLLLIANVALFGYAFTASLFIVFPLLVGISFRLGTRGAAQAVITTGLAAFVSVILGTGPFAALQRVTGEGFLLQMFILTVIYTVLPAAGAVAGRLLAQAQLEATHRELVDASRLAGRAEVATNILHNVGNVLNSVNVSTALLREHAKQSSTLNLQRAVNLFDKQDWITFATSERGKQLPAFLTALAAQLALERESVIHELDTLQDNVEHINAIVAMQQDHARRVIETESLDLQGLIEDSLRISSRDLGAHGIELIKDLQSLPAFRTDKHRVRQILVNLINNARNACDESQTENKRITVRMVETHTGVAISVTDNGAGIAAENLARIFNHGFTTRASGHGYGLHSGALAAKELGGSLTVRSEGVGRGATFTLELPSTIPNARDDTEGRDGTLQDLARVVT